MFTGHCNAWAGWDRGALFSNVTKGSQPSVTSKAHAMVPYNSGGCRFLGLGDPRTSHQSETFGIPIEELVMLIPDLMSYSLK